MGPEDIEQLLKSAKFKHLSEATLVSYLDNQLDKAALALANAHLKLCHICERRLTFLKEEAEALESYVITEEDRAAIGRTIKELKPDSKSPDYIKTEIERLKSYISDLLEAWIVPFRVQAMRGTRDGDEIWRYQSEDGLLTAWAILEKNKSLTVHFSSPELSWEGIRIQFRLGPFSKKVTLKRKGDLVTAKIRIPSSSRPKKMYDISIEIV